jgi:hypothetical protein
MDVVIVAIVLVALTAFVAAPLYAPSAPKDVGGGDPSVQARHQALVGALRELEVDHASGLLPDGDYEREREALEREAGDTLADPPDPLPS